MLIEDLLSQESILERVDTYSIYSFYIGKELEVGRAYCSPLRVDDNIPSFALFEYQSTLLFKDHGINEAGNVFKFIKLLFDYKTMEDVYERINMDFDLELVGRNDYVKPVNKAKRINGFKVKPKLEKIEISSKNQNSFEFIEYWKGYDIVKEVRDYYNTTEPVIVYFTYKDGKEIIFYPKSLCIAYRIYDKYKTCMPKEDKRNKWKTNFPEAYVEGYLQLKYEKDFCIITKSMKEAMFFRQHFDWDSVAGKSESTMIKRFIMLKLLSKFKYIFIWMDNDIAGQRAQRKYMEKYPFLIPVFINHKRKDPTDMYKYSSNKKEILNIIYNLIWQHLNKK